MWGSLPVVLRTRQMCHVRVLCCARGLDLLGWASLEATGLEHLCLPQLSLNGRGRREPLVHPPSCFVFKQRQKRCLACPTQCCRSFHLRTSRLEMSLLQDQGCDCLIRMSGSAVGSSQPIIQLWLWSWLVTQTSKKASFRSGDLSSFFAFTHQTPWSRGRQLQRREVAGASAKPALLGLTQFSEPRQAIAPSWRPWRAWRLLPPPLTPPSSPWASPQVAAHRGWR